MGPKRAYLLVALMLIIFAGCRKRGTATSLIDLGEKAVEIAVGDFKQKLVLLSLDYPSLAGVESFPCSYLGFTYVNNAVEPRLYIAVTVEDASAGELRTVPVGGKKIPGTEFVSALQLECADPELKRGIEAAYSELINDLKEVN